MKAYRILTIIFIIITVFLIIIGGIYSIINYKYNQIEKLIYEAELRKTDETHEKEKLEYEAEERIKLQEEADQEEKLQYELMLQTIKDNSDYYVTFSEKFISVYEEFGYNEFHSVYGFYDAFKLDGRLEYDLNSDLVIYESHIRIEEGIRYVEIAYPVNVGGFNYTQDFVEQYFYDYWIIYIPDEYIDEESITELLTEIYDITLVNVKDNLFVACRNTTYYRISSKNNEYVMY
jgi:hypothetical protein